ncbi:Protein of unknown function [Thermobacillus xylanilyticus]|uniref:Uncharacterized protein n=1 Tax=Thermobacillus xylanilyticus TaxID=76633 RepID=A0ABM8V858_THEXY|nr:Protein of unknown function [Thermobacillus xylanilyticus]
MTWKCMAITRNQEGMYSYYTEHMFVIQARKA